MTLLIQFILIYQSAFAELTIPEYCKFTKKDTEAPVARNGFMSLVHKAKDATGRSAMRFLEKGYSRRTDLEKRLIERNPSYALPYATSNLFAPILSGMMCNEFVDDMYLAGGLNHFLIAAIVTAQIGRDDGCKLVMSHEMGDTLIDNSNMDIRNNLLGNQAGVTHRREILDCVNLMSQMMTQKIQSEKQTDMFSIFEDLGVFKQPAVNITDLSPQSIANRLSITNSSPNNIANPNACNNLQAIIKNQYASRIYFTESTACDDKMGGTATTAPTSAPEHEAFTKYRNNMVEALK